MKSFASGPNRRLLFISSVYRFSVVIFGDAEGHLKEFLMGLWCEKKGWPALPDALSWLLTSTSTLSVSTVGHFNFSSSCPVHGGDFFFFFPKQPLRRFARLEQKCETFVWTDTQIFGTVPFYLIKYIRARFALCNFHWFKFTFNLDQKHKKASKILKT